MTPITRLSGMTPTRSRAVRRGHLIYTVAVADTAEQDMQRQTTETLAKIERFLKDAGSDKSRLLSCTVYICDMALKPQMNAAWDAWVDMDNAPQRACIGATLEHPHMVEIVCVAATKD
jgi:enamine deaminase RidA (YjgF/YER057c/UK114 family)